MFVDDEMARHRGAVLPGFERADARRQSFGKHRHDLVGEIDAVAAPARLAVEVAVGADIIADVGDRGDREETALVADRKSVVQGKSVSVRVDLGGRRHINKKKKYKNT